MDIIIARYRFLSLQIHIIIMFSIANIPITEYLFMFCSLSADLHHLCIMCAAAYKARLQMYDDNYGQNK